MGWGAGGEIFNWGHETHTVDSKSTSEIPHSLQNGEVVKKLIIASVLRLTPKKVDGHWNFPCEIPNTVKIGLVLRF